MTVSGEGREPRPHAFFFTSLMLENVMPSARSLVYAEIEFILGQEHRIAVDNRRRRGTVGGDERVELLAIVG